jgi:hypothetical protein
MLDTIDDENELNYEYKENCKDELVCLDQLLHIIKPVESKTDFTTTT